jgi:hypothetical protein
MGFKRMVALAGIGGLLYAHRKHGGQWTFESFQQSFNDLIDGAKTRAKDLRSQAESRLHEAAAKVSDATDTVESFTGAKDVTGYGSSSYGYSGGSKIR